MTQLHFLKQALRLDSEADQEVDINDGQAKFLNHLCDGEREQ